MSSKIRTRKVVFYGLMAEANSKSKRFNRGESAQLLQALRAIQPNMKWLHYETGTHKAKPTGYTRILAKEQTDEYTLLLIDHGSADNLHYLSSTGNEAPRPVTEHQDDPNSVPAVSCHVIIWHAALTDGSHNAMIEYVTKISRTTIELFLNHLFYAEPACRDVRDGYMVYCKVRLEARLNLSLSQFCDFQDLDARVELIVPAGAIDAEVDDAFEITMRHSLKAAALSKKLSAWWLPFRQRDDARLRVTATHNGERFTCESAELPDDYNTLKFARAAAVHFKPPLAHHHQQIHPQMRDNMVVWARPT